VRQRLFSQKSIQNLVLGLEVSMAVAQHECAECSRSWPSTCVSVKAADAGQSEFRKPSSQAPKLPSSQAPKLPSSQAPLIHRKVKANLKSVMCCSSLVISGMLCPLPSILCVIGKFCGGHGLFSLVSLGFRIGGAPFPTQATFRQRVGMDPLRKKIRNQ